MTSWDRIHEKILKKWASMSKTYSVMHSLSAQHYSKLQSRLGIPVILLGAITASSIFSGADPSGVGEVMVYVNGSLALLMTGLSGISNFLSIPEKVSKHQVASFKYTNIAMNIDALLSFKRLDREKTPQQFIQKVKADMLEIRENSPEVIISVMEDYLRGYDKSLTDNNSTVNKTKSATSKVLDTQKKMMKNGESNEMILLADQISTSETSECEAIDKFVALVNKAILKWVKPKEYLNMIYDGDVVIDFNDEHSRDMDIASKQLSLINCSSIDQDDSSSDEDQQL